MRRALLLLVVVAFAACKVGERTDETVTVREPTRPETRTCSSPFALPDEGALEACGNGKGHCYAAAKQPITPGELEACGDGEVCVPDKILRANGAKMKACTFLGGKLPGACTSTLLAQIHEHASELTQDVCDADERCAPCDDPRTGENTGTCDATGVHTQACIGGEGAAGESCCHASGVCLDREAVPADSRDDMQRDTCTKASQVCAPLSLADGLPVGCDVLGFSGVCLDVCFASLLRGTTAVTRSSCGPTELCLPCLIGSGKGIPGCD